DELGSIGPERKLSLGPIERTQGIASNGSQIAPSISVGSPGTLDHRSARRKRGRNDSRGNLATLAVRRHLRMPLDQRFPMISDLLGVTDQGPLHPRLLALRLGTIF